MLECVDQHKLALYGLADKTTFLQPGSSVRPFIGKSHFTGKGNFI